MKTTLKRILVVLSVALLLFSFASCGGTDVKKAFENAGYTVKTISAKTEDKDDAKIISSALSMLTLMGVEEDDIEKYEVIVAVKGEMNDPDEYALMIKFPSAGKIKDMLNKLGEGTYDKGKEMGMINGAYVCVDASDAAQEIFKK